MSNIIQPNDLKTFRGPVRAALTQFSEDTNGDLEFAISEASTLEMTPEKRTSARSTTLAQYMGKPIGNLVVVAFAPGDSTGDGTPQQLQTTSTGGYPNHPGVLARSKRALHTELHLPLASYQPDSVAPSDVVLFAGSLDLLSLRGQQASRLTALGQQPLTYQRHLELGASAQAVTTTTGYHGDGVRRPSQVALAEQRFGDPHAVYNATSSVQLCAFIGITPEYIEHGFDAVTALDAHTPLFVPGR